MSGKYINIPYHSRTLPGYMAEPLEGQNPGVVVIGAIFGVDDDIKAITDRLAANGYPAIAPNMFWEDAEDTDVLPVSPEGSERGRGRAARVNRDAGVAYIAAAMETLRASPRCNGKIALQGYCFGGPFMVQATARLDVSAGFSCPTMALRLMVSPPPRVLLSKLSKVPLVPLPGLPGLPRPLPTEFGLPNGDACGSRPWMP